MTDSYEFLARVEVIFNEILELPEAERATLLSERCGNDQPLREEVQLLLRANEAEARATLFKHIQDDSATPDAAPVRRIGPYRIDSLLARGGMGAVYLAHRDDGQFQQEVAIKLIDLPLAGPLFKERFRFERQVLASLVHPYIARLLDGGVSEQGELYLVMEYVNGVPIHKYCDDRQLPIRTRLELFRQVCEAVDFAHKNLIVHRDLKPDNILVSDDALPHLLDFGTAKLLEPESALTAGQTGSQSNFTVHGYQSFTPQFASPEQILGEPITTASDSYSLGVLLFLLLTGLQPYELRDFSTAEMIRVVCHEQPQRPSQVTTHTEKPDSDLDAITLKALRKEPGERYQTVYELIVDVDAYFAGRPVAARRGTLRYRTGKFLRRNKLGVIAAFILLLILAGGIAAVLWQAHLAQVQADIAQVQKKRAEARANDLRQLSNSLLSEIDEAIKELPGSTPVQHLLVERVVEHLDRMAKDADGDRPLLIDIANGYVQLAEIQGNSYSQNIGDVAGAMTNLKKALVIARSLVQSNKTDKAGRQLLGNVLYTLSETDVNPSSSLAEISEAIETHTKVLSDFGESVEVVDALADDYNILSDDDWYYLKQSVDALHAAQTSATYIRRSAQLAPHDPETLRRLILRMEKVGRLETYVDPYRSLQDLQSGITLWNTQSDKVKATNAGQRILELLEDDLGENFAMVGNRSQAKQSMQSALLIAQQQLALNPKDSRAQYDLYAAYDVFASIAEDDQDPRIPLDAKTREGSVEAALSLRLRAITLLDGLLKSGLTDEYYRENLMESYAALAGTKRAQHKTREAIDLEESYIPALQKMTSEKDLLSDASSELGKAMATASGPLRNTDAAVKYASKAVEMSHHQDIQVLLVLAEAYRANNEIDKCHATAREALGLMTPLKAGQSLTRFHKLLNYELNH